MIKDTWFDVLPIDAATYALYEPGHWERCLSYLVMGEQAAALIDTGLGIANIKHVTDQLTDLPIKVLTTHVHWDHIGGHGLYDQIYLHAGDRDWLANGLPMPLSVIRAGLMRDPLTRPTPPEFAPAEYQPFRGQPSGLLSDSEIVDLGGRQLMALHTPGHSPGHLSFFEAERGYLYTGDLLYQGTLYAFYPSTDPLAYAASVARLAQLPGVNKLLPGHNALDVPSHLLPQADAAFRRLAEQNQLHHGSGLHDFGLFQIKL